MITVQYICEVHLRRNHTHRSMQSPKLAGASQYTVTFEDGPLGAGMMTEVNTKQVVVTKVKHQALGEAVESLRRAERSPCEDKSRYYRAESEQSWVFCR